jgi:hypothetical protein
MAGKRRPTVREPASTRFAAQHDDGVEDYLPHPEEARPAFAAEAAASAE